MIITQKQLDIIDKKIIDLCADGKTYKEISKIVNISTGAVVNRVREMKKYFRCESLTQLVLTIKNHK